MDAMREMFSSNNELYSLQFQCAVQIKSAYCSGKDLTLTKVKRCGIIHIAS